MLCGCQRPVVSGVCSPVVAVEYPRPLLSCGVNKWVWGSLTETGARVFLLWNVHWGVSSVVSPETRFAGSQRTLSWALPSALLQSWECWQPSVSLRCFVHKATSAELVKAGARAAAVIYVDPPREPGGRLDPSLLSRAHARTSRARPVPAAGAPAVHLDVL